MKQSLVFFLAVVAVASAAHYPEEFGQKLIAHLFDLANQQPEAYENNDVEPEPLDFAESNFEEPESRNFILSSIGKKVIKGIFAQMPCGWPDLGIPPLAPYRREEMNVHLKKSIFETSTKLVRFGLHGLENIKIDKLSIGLIKKKKIKYNFTFPRISISGKYVTDTIVNLMQEFGISVGYDGDGDFEIVLENLNIAGQINYKIPLFNGIKITKFETVVTLGNFGSHIEGLMGKGRINNIINKMIENVVLWAVNGNQKLISSTIEHIIVPAFNNKMEGNKLWSLFTRDVGSSRKGGKCVPPPDPWA